MNQSRTNFCSVASEFRVDFRTPQAEFRVALIKDAYLSRPLGLQDGFILNPQSEYLKDKILKTKNKCI